MRRILLALVAGGGALLIVGASWLAWWNATVSTGSGPTLSTDFARLHSAAAGTRPLLPRLSGVSDHRPWASPPHGDTLPRDLPADLLDAASALERRARAEPIESRIHAELGIARLLTGDVDTAIVVLEASVAAREPSAGAALLSDLAASYLSRGLARDAPEDVLQALEHIGRALRVDARLVEARFNRALAAEFLGPASQAIAAWDDYVSLDPESPWAAEARERRARIAIDRQNKSDAFARNPRSRRAIVEEELLLEWSRATLAGETARAADAVRRARALAWSARGDGHDPYVRDLVELVERATATGRGAALAAAYRDAHEARGQIVNRNEIDAGRRRLLTAAEHAGASGALANYLAYWTLLTDWYRGRPEAIEQPLRALIVRAARAGHTFIVARASILLGSVLHRLARYADAIDAYQRGVDGLAALGETDAEASSRMLLAGALRDHGLWRDAWASERAALARFDDLAGQAQRHNVIREAVRLAIVRRQPEVAAYFLDVLAAEARQWNDVAALLAVDIYRARIALLRGSIDEAAAALAEAERRFETIPDPSFRQSYQLDLANVRTEVQTRVNPALAVASAKQLVTGTERSGSLFRLVRGYWLLGRAAEAAGDAASAIDAWRAGIAALERDSLQVREERMRIARTSEVWDIYEDLMRTMIDAGRPGDALTIAERGRSRALLTNVQRTAPPSAAATTAIDGTVVYFATLADRTSVWVLDGDTTTSRVSPGGARALRPLLAALDAVSLPSDPRPVLEDLYRLLIAPIADLLRPGRPLTFVTDGPTTAVPFAALRSSLTGRLLIEDHAITLAPSLELLRIASARLRDRPLRLKRLAAAGDATSAGLAPLPGARRELDGIVRLYGATALTGEHLTRDGLLSIVRSADTLHFAGHAVADAEFPARSFLALHGTGAGARLAAEAITAESFGHLQLVILSACATGSGMAMRGEGVLSLARPFLGSGIPYVLATQRSVHDDIESLMVEFHRRLRAGDAPAAALRAAQLAAFARDRRVDLRGWAAFSLFGVNQPPDGRRLAVSEDRAPHSDKGRRKDP